MAPVPPNLKPISMQDMPAGAVIFTHIDEHTGAVTTYSITHLWQVVAGLVRKGLRPTRLKVDGKFAKFVKQHRGIERHRLDRIKKKHLEEPVLFATQFDGTQLLIDGSHRYVKAANLMQRTIPAYVLPPEIWYPCTVDTGEENFTPQALLGMKSGIK